MKKGMVSPSAPPGEAATALVRLLYDDGREAMLGGLSAIPDARVCMSCTKLQLEVLGACMGLETLTARVQLRDGDPSSSSEKHYKPRHTLVAVAGALAARPDALDSILAFLDGLPHIGYAPRDAASVAADHAPGVRHAMRDEYLRATAGPERYTPAPERAVTNELSLAMRDGPVGLLHSLARGGSNPVLVALVASPWFARALARLARFIAAVCENEGARPYLSEDNGRHMLAFLSADFMGSLVSAEASAAAPVSAVLVADDDAVAGLEYLRDSEFGTESDDEFVACCAALLCFVRGLLT